MGRALAARRASVRADDGALRVGITWQKDTQELFARLRVNAETGDYLAAAAAVVADINARGGVRGQRVVLVPHEDVATESLVQPDLAAQQACEHFLESHVDVVVSVVSTINLPSMFECLARGDVPAVILDPNPHFLRSEFQRFPGHLYHAAAPAADRLAPLWVERLAAQGWLRGWDTEAGEPGGRAVRVGIVHQSGSEPYAEALGSALRAHGVPAPVVATYSDFADMGNKAPSFAVRFRAAGVTHVFVDKPLTTMVFARASEDQRYRPRYGLASYNAPTLALQDQDLVPRQQLRGALGVGFQPLADVSDHAAFRRPGSAAHACEQVTGRAGIVARSTMARLIQHVHCDALWLLDDAYTAAGGYSAAHLRHALEGLRPWAPAATMGARFGPRRHDAASLVRDVAYDRRCGCFVYRGPLNLV